MVDTEGDEGSDGNLEGFSSSGDIAGLLDRAPYLEIPALCILWRFICDITCLKCSLAKC